MGSIKTKTVKLVLVRLTQNPDNVSELSDMFTRELLLLDKYPTKRIAVVQSGHYYHFVKGNLLSL